MKKRFGLLGEKLGHSFSPLIHKYLGDYDYSLFEVAPGDLGAFMAGRRFDGINVTIPYKQAVLPYCDSVSGEARDIGSVNTIIKDTDGSLHGYNTDIFGFCFMLERAGIDPGGKKSIILGSGGSARTVRYALDRLDAREIVTISRRGDDNYDNISRHFDADIIVNTTPVGMYPGNGASPVRLDSFARLAGVADLIYNPLRTKLLLDAESLGIPCVNGLAMLVAQAEMASRLFLDVPARPELIDAIRAEITGKMRNVILIGMPGSGKSTVGAALAGQMGRQFIDIDEKIASAAGKSIPAIFSEDGEDAFRRLETRVTADESKKSGAVIATGGGVVTRPENLDLLRQNGIIIYLERDTGELPSDGRPLSQAVGVRALAERRIPLYKAWSDYTVETVADVDATADRIMDIISRNEARR